VKPLQMIKKTMRRKEVIKYLWPNLICLGGLKREVDTRQSGALKSDSKGNNGKGN